MSHVEATNTPVVPDYSSSVSGEFGENNEFTLTSTKKGRKSTKTYSVKKAEEGLVVERHIKFLGHTIAKRRVSPRSVIFRGEGKKVYTAIAKQYLKTDFKDLSKDGTDDVSAGRICNLKRLMAQFDSLESVVGLVADLPPQQGAKLLTWCAENPNLLPEPLSVKVKENPARFVAACVRCALNEGYGSKFSPYNSQVSPKPQEHCIDLVKHLARYNDNFSCCCT